MPENLPINMFQNSGWKVRVIMRDNEPWFVAKDVAECLGYANPKTSIRDHCKHAEIFKGHKSCPLESPRGLLIIPESDLYRLVLRSHMPEAEAFQDWIVEVVIPSIRKTGSYSISHNQALESKVQAIEEILVKLLESNQVYLNKIAQDKVYVDMGKTFMDMPGTMSMSETANYISQFIGMEIGRTRLFKILRKNGIIFKKGYAPTKKGENLGFKEDWIEYPNNPNKYKTTRVTRKALRYIIDLLANSMKQAPLAGVCVFEIKRLELC